MEQNLRVHISPVGFEVRRVVDPLFRMNADKVYLVTRSADDQARLCFRKIKDQLAPIKNIRVEEKFVDVWNLYACIPLFREIIFKERNNHVYVNVSTGTKITAIAGMISCMIWGATPYYAKVSYITPGSGLEPAQPPLSELVQDPSVLPEFNIRTPKEVMLLILKMLKENNGKLRKTDMIEKLMGEKIIRPKEEDLTEFSESARHSQLRVILEPMIHEWKFVQTELSGRRATVVLTPLGESALQIFGAPEKEKLQEFIY